MSRSELSLPLPSARSTLEKVSAAASAHWGWPCHNSSALGKYQGLKNLLNSKGWDFV
jgi:hypothetical protein